MDYHSTGTAKNIRIHLKYHLFQISLVTECTIKRVGDLPFDFSGGGACGSFMINSSPTIFLCFESEKSTPSRQCRSLTRKNDGSLSDIIISENFVFAAEFEVNEVPDSAYSHWRTKMANYLGFPLVLGGFGDDRPHSKLEMLNTMKTTPAWIEHEGTDYPYSNS